MVETALYYAIELKQHKLYKTKKLPHLKRDSFDGIAILFLNFYFVFFASSAIGFASFLAGSSFLSLAFII